jgi:hypothetical protein
MAKKIYVKSNYFYIVDTETDKIFEGLAKEVRVRKEFIDSTSFFFDNVNGFSNLASVNFSDIQDENGDAYADIDTFISFYEDNTGNFNTPQAGGGGKELILLISQSGTDAPTFTIKKNTSDYAEADIVPFINLDLPNVMNFGLQIGENNLFPILKNIQFTNFLDKLDAENQLIYSCVIREIADSLVKFQSGVLNVSNGSFSYQGDICSGFLKLEF